MDRQFRALVDQVAAGVIARREFLRKTAILTGGTAAGLHALGRLARAQPEGARRYRGALRAVGRLPARRASAKGGFLPFAERAMKSDGKFLGVPRYSMTTVFFIRKDIMEAKGLKPPKVYDPDVVTFAQKTTDPAKDLWGFGQTLNRSDDGEGVMSNILWEYGGGGGGKGGEAGPRAPVLQA